MQNTRYDYDLFVIGAGSGGVRASRVAASLGARVGICEESLVGGTCVIRGCVPKKLMVYGAHYRWHFEDSRAYGWEPGDSAPDWPTLIANKDTEIDRLNGIYISMLEKAGVELYQERGVMEDAHTVRVGDERITADKILVATGSWPEKPDVPGAELAITSNEAFHLERCPGRIVVVGGGYIAAEFASIFRGYGSEVIQLYRRDRILRGFDDDVRDAVADGLRHHGIELRTHLNVEGVEKRGEGVRLSLNDGTSLDADHVMFATGRSPNTAGLGCEAAGVELGANGAVIVDEYSRTSAENIYAVGDVTDRVNLTPVALMEGQAVANTLFGDEPVKPDHVNVPKAVFSIPPASVVGLSEAEARELGDVKIYRTRFRPMRHTLTGRQEKIMMKLVVDANTDTVMGAHMVGEDAAEIIQGLAVAIKAGATKAQFDATVGIHPTAAEEFVTMRKPVEADKVA